MVKIRLKRVGKKKQPSYRVVVADSRSPRDGRIIEAIGHYNPRREPSDIVIDTERAQYWIGRGAQPSDTVRKLLDLALSGRLVRPGEETPPAQVTPAREIKATPAASVRAGQVDEEEAPEAEEPPARLPEAADQAAAAPDADAAGAPAPADGEDQESQP